MTPEQMSILTEGSHFTLAQLEGFFEEFPMATYLIEKDSTLLFSNKEARLMFEYKAQEMKGISVLQMIKDLNKEEWNTHWEHLKSKKSLDLYNTHITKNGREFQLEIFANLILLEGKEYNLSFARLRDVEYLLEERFRKQQEFFSILTENVSEILWVMDVEHKRFRYVSKSAEKILEYSTDEILQMGPDDLIQKDVLKEKSSTMHENLIKYLNHEGENFTDEIPHVTKSGKVIIGEIRTRFYENPETGRLEIVGVTTDITERKKTESELQENNMNLEALSKTKDKFISIISHDLRGPIFSFVQLTEMLSSSMRSMPFKEVEEALLKMNRSAINIASLLENLLNWSRLQQGRIEVQKTEFNVMEALQEIWNMSLELGRQKGLQMSCNIPDDLKVFSDEKMLQTIVRNLLSNAIKFTQPPKLVALKFISLTETHLTLSVEDEGIGMSPEQLAAIEENLVKSGKKGSMGEPGSGIGLLLCREFVELLQGTLHIESKSGMGSRFRIILPVK